jgi:hypothetical protein
MTQQVYQRQFCSTGLRHTPVDDSRFCRSTNVTPPSHNPQVGGSCYAHAAAIAYLNTHKRIAGSNRRAPSYAEALEVADYTHGHGGDPKEAIRRLEAAFDCGVLCSASSANSTEERFTDIFQISVIVHFRTSQAGYENVAAGQLLTHPGGEVAGPGHAVLVESCDLETELCTAVNSWGHEDGTQERFDFRFEAFHSYNITNVYFTLDSIAGKTDGLFVPQKIRFRGKLHGEDIDCAYMDEYTADYDSEFYSREPVPLQGTRLELLEFPLRLGYETRQYVRIKLSEYRHQRPFQRPRRTGTVWA